MNGGSVEIRVRYAETDQMGLAHHSHYLVWCELGRTALMRHAGVPYSGLEKEGILLPVTRAEVEYRAGVGYDERVRVETRVTDVRSRRVVFAYEVRRAADGELLARVRTDLVCTDREGRPRRLPGAARSKLQEACAGGKETDAGR